MLCFVSQTLAVVVGIGMKWLVVNGSFLEDLVLLMEVGNLPQQLLSRKSSGVLLNRRNNAIGPEGLYRCDVIDARNINQSGVYKVDRGECVYNDYHYLLT